MTVVSSSKSSRFCGFCFYFLAFVTFAFAAAMLSLVLLTNRGISQNHREFSGLMEEVCMVCKELKTTVYVDPKADDLLTKLHVKQAGGDTGEMCCAKTFNQLLIIMKLLTKRQESMTYGRPAPAMSAADTQAVSTASAVYAHKVLKFNPKFAPYDRGNGPRFSRQGACLLMNHTANDIRFEQSQGVRLLPYGIQIIQPGLYYIYQSVSIIEKRICDRNGELYRTFSSVLMRNSTASGQVRSLLRSDHTCCPGCKIDRDTTFTAGQFVLDKGDILQAKVSSINLVDFDKETGSYIGVILTGDSSRQGTEIDSK